MNHPDGHDSALGQFIWPSPDGILDRKDLLLRLRAEQRFMAAQDPACRLDQRDYLLSLVDSASTRADGAAQRSGFDARRMRSVITEAATRSHWGKPSGGRRTQGIAAHYDAQTCMAAVLDVELSDEGRLIVHDTVFVADLGAVENPGRLRAQLEGACLMGVAFVASAEFGVTAADLCPTIAQRPRWPLISWLPGRIAVHLINPTGALQACLPSQMSYVPIVRALCNAIRKASDKRTSDVPPRSQLLERTGGR
ncbi:molybdopterin-dependent oxidoreductase [Pseudomonas sp. B21-054]|uniref:molybdopterin-dependent oxidoreductase n=1 Tax=Pseudomonas sp. B21-054 TaxID=2895494 RepID=UPI002232116A|nr:molybdopterin-dependent oxidoreductase [Pseudomonas sp. B21-054]UZE15816.1 molybdopterin-dependent oxidoreductase [Pseudomonas sp. B21-054]